MSCLLGLCFLFYCAAGETRARQLPQRVHSPQRRQSAMASATDIEEAFNLFDRGGSGKVSFDDFGTVIRALGQNPTQEELVRTARCATGAAIAKHAHFSVPMSQRWFGTESGPYPRYHALEASAWSTMHTHLADAPTASDHDDLEQRVLV